MKKPHISVVVPAYNEAKLIALTLTKLDKYFIDFKSGYEIIVVNDGSTDDTSKVVQKFIKLIPNLSLIEHEVNHGKGGAVRTGMLKATGKHRLFMDADSSIPIEALDGLMSFMGEKHDIVIGSRNLSGSIADASRPWYRRLFGVLGNLYIRALILPQIKDSQCGFKLFTEESAEFLFPLLKTRGWSFDVEILALANKMGHKVKEVPIRWVDGPDSKVRPMSYIQVLVDVLKVRWWLWRDSHHVLGRNKDE